jgi:hypothetical protein
MVLNKPVNCAVMNTPTAATTIPTIHFVTFVTAPALVGFGGSDGPAGFSTVMLGPLTGRMTDLGGFPRRPETAAIINA